MEINLQDYVRGVFQVMLHTMRCMHGSNYEVLSEWDHGPIYFSRGYGTLVDQASPLDQAFLLI